MSELIACHGVGRISPSNTASIDWPSECRLAVNHHSIKENAFSHFLSNSVTVRVHSCTTNQ